MAIGTAIRRLCLLTVVAAVLPACTTMNSMREQHPDPNDRLDALLELYDEARDQGDHCQEIWRTGNEVIDCHRIVREVERLYAEYPNQPRVIMANAVLAYEGGDREKAQFMLDQLLDQYGAHPEAAILRARIALEEGNTTLARDLLQRQIRLAPDRADLREALGAALYVQGQYSTARVALGLAGRLGGPGWRISYHQGLICEAQDNWDEACRFYATALQQKDNYEPAWSRLRGLSQYAECRRMMVEVVSPYQHGEPTPPAAAEGEPVAYSIEEARAASVASNDNGISATVPYRDAADTGFRD